MLINTFKMPFSRDHQSGLRLTGCRPMDPGWRGPRLLAKNAEARYQSARGLGADLERCLLAWEEMGEIAAFPLAESEGKGLGATFRLRFPIATVGPADIAAARSEA